MWLRFALFSALLTPLLHVVVLIANGQDPVATPISQLSRARFSELQHVALALFGFAHLALAIAIGGLDRGRLWPLARLLLVTSGTGLGYIAHYFATSAATTLTGAAANDPLWIVASLTGLAMGAMQPGIARLSLGLGMFGVLCLGLWLMLVPLNFFVTPDWLGLYERIVGGVYVIWIVGMASGLLTHCNGNGSRPRGEPQMPAG